MAVCIAVGDAQGGWRFHQRFHQVRPGFLGKNSIPGCRLAEFAGEFACISLDFFNFTHTHKWLFDAILIYVIGLTYFQTLTFREPAWEYGG